MPDQQPLMRSGIGSCAILILLSQVLVGCFLLGPPRHIVEPPGVHITRDIAIGERDGRALKVDIYRRADAQEQQPIALWIHGGGWMIGSRSPCPIAPLALRGYTIVALEYRLSRDGLWPAQELDLLHAVDWVIANASEYGMDPTRIVAWGASAGAHLAMRLGQGDNPRVQAVVAWFPPTDLPRLSEESQDWRMRMSLRRLVGGDPREDSAARSLAQEASIDPLLPRVPTLIIHGDRDRYIPVVHSTDFVSTSAANGAVTEVMVLEGVGHGNRVLGNAQARARSHAFQDPLMRPLIPEGAPE